MNEVSIRRASRMLTSELCSKEPLEQYWCDPAKIYFTTHYSGWNVDPPLQFWVGTTKHAMERTKRSKLSFSLHCVTPFLADRKYGRAYATGLRPSVVCMECIVAKRCVLEQKLLLKAYRKSYMRHRLVPKWITLSPWPLLSGRLGVPRWKPHRRSGLANLPSVGAVP